MRKNAVIIIICSVLVVLVAPFIGSNALSLSDIFSFSGGDAEIFWRLRVPRVMMSFIAGVALSCGGLVFQALFRNPLATPYTLGVASGASLGTAIFFMFGAAGTIGGMLGGSIFSFAGATFAIFLVYGLGRSLGGNNNTMLLVGVALNFSFSSMIMFIQYTANFISSHRIVRFMIGGLDSSSFRTVFFTLPFVCLGVLTVLLYRRELDLIATGEEVAVSRGVNVSRLKLLVYFSTSLMLGWVISVTGPIGFVGMMAPHICRIFVGSSHIRLAPVAVMFGGAFLTACDTLARTVIYPTEIPVGVLTSMLGGPFFIFLLLKKRIKG